MNTAISLCEPAIFCSSSRFSNRARTWLHRDVDDSFLGIALSPEDHSKMPGR